MKTFLYDRLTKGKADSKKKFNKFITEILLQSAQQEEDIFFLLMSHRLVSFTVQSTKFISFVSSGLQPAFSKINEKAKNLESRCEAFSRDPSICRYFGGFGRLKGYIISSSCLPQISIFKNIFYYLCFDILFIFICDNHAYFYCLKSS